MNKVFTFIRDRHNAIFKAFLFVLSVAAIVFIFPREGKFKYEFQKGKPWPHEDLIAPFNYPISKSAKALEEERERVAKEQKPYFFRNQQIEKEVAKLYEERFTDAWISFQNNYEEAKGRDYYFEKGKKALQSLYDKGIIELHRTVEGKSGDYEIHLLTDNISETKSLSEFYTIQEAFKLLSNKFGQLKEVERQFLLNVLEDCLRRNVIYDPETNELQKQQALDQISPTIGMIQEGERVIAKGELINDQKYQLVESLKREYESQLGDGSQLSLILLGQIILVSLMILSLAMFLMSYRQEILRSDVKILFLLLLIVLFVFASKMAINIENVNLYLVPFCMLPLLIRTFFDLRLALFTHLVAVLIVGFIAPNPYEFIIIQMIAGILTLFSIINLRNRSQLFLSSLIIFVVYTFVYLGIGLIQEGSFADTNWKFLGWFFGSAMLTLFTYPLVNSLTFPLLQKEAV